MKLAIVLVIAIGLCVFGYFETRKKVSGEDQVAAVTTLLNTTQQKLNTTENELTQAKRELESSTQRLTELEESKKVELAALQTKMDETTKQVTESTSEESKKQMAELTELRTKMTAMETELNQAKSAASTLQTEAATNKAEVQRLQQQQARPPLGTVLDRKK